MAADRSRPRICLGTITAAVMALGLSAPALGAKTPPSGSSCAHPVVMTLHRGQKAVGYHRQIIIAAEPQLDVPGVRTAVEWWGWSGPGAEDTDIICSARIQRLDGSWVGPTRLKPYATPTPMGGEYEETTDPGTQYRQVVVEFAKSPVPRGASCDYPLMSRAGNSQARDPSAVFRVDTPQSGMDEVAVTIHNPNIVVCRATAIEESEPATIPGSSFEFVRSLPITIGEHGGLSSPLPQPKATDGILAVRVYSRYLHLSRPSPPQLHLSQPVLDSFIGAGVVASTGHGLITGEVEPPKTVRQCEEKFGTKNAHERYLRAKCIKRVEHELATAPGTSCKYPLEFNRGLEGGNGSSKYLGLKLTGVTNAQRTGATMTWTWEVKSSKVEICPKGVTFELTPSLPNGNDDIGHPSVVKHPETTTRRGSFSYFLSEKDTGGAAIKIKARFVKPPKK